MEKPKNDQYDEKPKREGRRVTYELADLSARLFALIIDGLILGLVGGLSSAGARSGAGFVVGFAISVAYHWYFLTRHNGQTPGKMLMHLRVVKADGSPLTGTDAVIRYCSGRCSTQPPGSHKLAKTYAGSARGE
jgi:uncharacterized RDD family membrane protein YckC